MMISTKGRYALRLMMDIAVHSNGELVALKDVARRQEISVKYLEQIVSQFGKLGLLESVRGPQGGYRLAKLPKDYTVGEILRYAEGELAPVACLEQEVNSCPRQAECVTLPFWQGLYKAINEYVDSVTLEDLLEQQRERISSEFYI